MKKTNNAHFEETQRLCMLRLVRDILSDESIAQITYENAHGAISVTRRQPEKRDICAIGFNADIIEDYEEDEE